MRIRALYFDGRAAVRTSVELEVHPDGNLWLFGRGLPQCYQLQDVNVSPRLGDIPRQLRLPDGGVCEVGDNEGLDRALVLAGHHDREGWVHRMESRWAWALAGVVGVVASVALAIVFGIPALARVTAAAISPELDRQLGEHALETLDGLVLQPSVLPPDEQARWRRVFAEVAGDVSGDWDFRLELRASRKLGANALALPSGIVVVTDDLIALAENDNEVRAVMAHEVGHVVNRHTLRMLLQQSVTGLLSLALIGDISSTSSLVAALPAVLVSATHSRQFESEADDFAFEWLDRHRIPRRYFAAMLKSLEEQGREESGQISYLSSHPLTADRIAKAEEAGGR
jgi:Zn-dependent protease with chaperone function